MKHLFGLSDAVWVAIDAHLPHGRPAKPRVDDRRVISGIPHLLKTGCRWRDVPAACGPPTTIHDRFNRWSRRGIWQRMVEAVAATGAVPPELSLDSTHVKDRRQRSAARAAGAPRRSLSGDHDGRLVAFGLAPGDIAVYQHGRASPYPLDRRPTSGATTRRLFCRQKNWRRIATHDDRLARTDLASLTLVATASECAS